MIRLFFLIACMTVAGMAATAVARAGIAGDVVRVDHKKQCLWLDWDNNTEKIACWTEKTKFSILETGKPAKAAELRKGSYVRMQGDDKGDTYWATEIVIWEAQSKPGLR
jgi:hypothetical protein